jgi:hypothetical protein
LTTTPLEAFETPQSDKRSQARIGVEEPILGPLCTLKIAVKARGEAALGNMLALEDATHCEVVASAGPGFGHQQRGKSVAVNAGTGGVENWVSERWEEPIEPQGLSESHQQERFNLQGSSKEMGTGTGSSGLEQMSGTGTLATSVGMGGSVGLGLSGSLGQEAGGGRSVSGRSSGLSEVDGVAPGFWGGRGGFHGVRGPNQGGAGTDFSQGICQH